VYGRVGILTPQSRFTNEIMKVEFKGFGDGVVYNRITGLLDFAHRSEF
jgi:hypothetical protein